MAIARSIHIVKYSVYDSFRWLQDSDHVSENAEISTRNINKENIDIQELYIMSCKIKLVCDLQIIGTVYIDTWYNKISSNGSFRLRNKTLYLEPEILEHWGLVLIWPNNS